MQRLTLREGDPAQAIEIAREVLDALVARDIVSAVRTATPGRWLVSAGSHVGVVRAGSVQVSIVPKIPTSRLIFLLGYARRPQHWRNDDVELSPHADLPEALAVALAETSLRALERGLLQGYVTVDDSTAVLRGRIREADQVRRHFGLMVPLEVTYDDYTVDIVENRLILSAVIRMLRTPGLARQTVLRLRRLRVALAEVTPLPAGSAIPIWIPNRLNARYAAALAISELILAGSSFEQVDGTLRVTGFMVWMPQVFEDFVCVALGAALESDHAGRARLQYRAHLDTAAKVAIRPDFVWEIGGRPSIVADAKYKNEKPGQFRHSDLYQMLAYCTILGLPDGHLVYARGGGGPAHHRVVGSDVSIHCHALDLEQAPGALLKDVQCLAKRMLDPPQIALAFTLSTKHLR